MWKKKINSTVGEILYDRSHNIIGFHPQSQKFEPEFDHFDTKSFQYKSI